MLFTESTVSEIQALARGLQILDILEGSTEGIRVTDAADKLGLDKSSVSRLMKTLANYGYAHQNPETRRYHLGARVISLGQSLLRRNTLRDHARPYLRMLVQRTGECAHLAVLSQNRALYIDQVDTSAPLRVSAGVGTQAPLHCTALGKVLLAFANTSIPDTLPAHTARTITDPDMLRLQLEQIRRQGYATDDEEFEYGARCIAVPIFDVDDQLAGALGISGPVGRLALERIPELANTVKRTGEELTAQLHLEGERR
jgi:DNA-binding IclR family transcriptional regulator